ncbi:RagB/SusD family nutrient uptake outer membrane protein [Flavivirga algicola]|uniref:RagB/SusD family nutrient uptake outer membrane protein n=1 Tax=Flavivirga algicola TaxID=2729136 RepID=A0ABX1RTH9_9FLAO|nr:RagB/SusD family nutrient uptake outer membrane protein [Flavivirga algicola]NMH86865.1 RagB/SusD family nutrient uptake outer membrane protein [Flavivirga algicola]
MKKLKINCVLLFIAIGFLFSCEEKLDLSDPNELSTGSFWKSLGDTNTGLTAAYQSLLDHDILQLVNEAIKTDEGWPGFGRPLGKTRALPYYELTYTNGSSYVENRWVSMYNTIFKANQVIEALENIKEDQTTEEEITLWTTQMGQARFLRGLMHFYLHSTYNNGSVIIRDFVPQTRDEFNQPLSPANEVQDFFRADLKYAYDNLPAQYEEPSVNLGRVTKGAAAVNLGKSYLFEKDYATAMVYFDDLINNVTADYNYKLVYDFDILFTSEGDFSEESILELSYSKDFREEIRVWSDQAISNRYAQSTVDAFGPLMPAWLVHTFKSDQMDILDDRNYYDDPDNGRTLKPVSLRTSSLVAIVEDDVSLRYGQTTGVSLKTSFNGWGFGAYKKYTNHDLDVTEGDGNPRGSRASGKNVVLDRLANVYLMQAECMIKTGDIDGALEAINTVRKRWGLVLLGPPNSRWSSSSFDNITYTADSLMEHLMYVEKPQEMCIEGYQTRWTDLRRWGVLEANFNRLAGETYYALTVKIKNVEGNEVNKNFASVNDENIDNVDGLKIIDYEYDAKAQNYNPESHDYLPIPLIEITANPNVN